jgi:DNA-binding beta-propeller fold protein YncE
MRRLVTAAIVVVVLMAGCSESGVSEGGEAAQPLATVAFERTQPATSTPTTSPDPPTATQASMPPPTSTVTAMPSATAAATATASLTATPVPVQQLVYVADTLNHRIVVFDGVAWMLVPGLGGQGGEPGQFDFPCSVAVDSRGRLYVTDSNNHRVQHFDGATWAVLSSGVGAGPGQFSRLRGVAVFPPAVSR